MSDVTFEVDTTGFDRALVEYKVATGKSWRDVIRQQARLLAVNLAYQTQPYGLGDASLRMGQGAVYRDVAKVYATPNEAYIELKKWSLEAARGFWKLYNDGKMARAKKILSRSPLGLVPFGPFKKEFHGQRRSRATGKVLGSGPSQIVQNPNKVNPYMTRKEKHVGMAKGAWKTCAKMLGGPRGIPAWVKDRGHGTVQDMSGAADNPRVVMNANVPYQDRVLTKNQMREAMRIQEEKMAAHIERVLEYNARKAFA